MKSTKIVVKLYTYEIFKVEYKLLLRRMNSKRYLHLYKVHSKTSINHFRF
jgi:hypothetical protein